MEQDVSRRRKLVSLVSVVALTFSGVAFSVVGASAAAADPGPVVQPASSAVTADALPTVQIDGVAWSQAVVGNTVYVGGSFANARPAGSAAGTNLTPRSNLLAYDITTGALITSFAPVVNGAVQSVSASPDGSRLYIAGDFTTVNGVTKNRVAAFNTATGALVTGFTVNIGTRVKSVVATNSTVYVGGLFTAANGQPRTRLAAFNAANGGLLGWNPGADYTVNALALTPDQSRVIVGGAFQNLGGAAAYGLGAVDATTGALLPWAANQKVRNAGASAAILSLSTDGTSIFGTGYTYGSGGNLEGTFSADPNSGSINWIEDCHGDTYGAYSTGQTVYTVSHAHYCGNVGGFPQSDPWSTNQRFAIAFTANATGTLNHDPLGYYDWYGNAGPSITNWFPELKIGTFTGQGQAAWSVTGNSQYVVMGGEFPAVNGTAQQGLVRFAVKPKAPAKRGPMVTGSKFMPSLVSLSSGTVRVAFQANWDQDDTTLTYKVVRNSNTAAPVFTTTADSTFWNRPNLGFTDTGLTPGATYKYRLYVTDSAGNQVAGDTTTITVSSAAALSPYAATVLQQGGGTYWRLGEPSGATAYDWAGYTDGVVGTGVTRGAAGAISGDANTASTFDGTGNGLVSAPAAITGPNTFTTEAWVNTTSTSGGKILGFGNQQSGGESSSYDRHIYMDDAGRIWFGVYPGGVATLNTTKSYNDGQWHQIVTSLGPDGMTLYVDGLRVGTRSDVTTAQPYTGYWRVGGDNIGGWPSQPSSNYLNGSIDDVSIYPTVLTKDQVLAQYVASGRTSPIPAVPSDAYGAMIYGAQPDLFWRLADASGTTAADASPSLNSGTYNGGVTLGQTGVIAGNTAATFNGSNGFVASANTFTNPTTYSEEAWFNTTTNRGGKIIGFGSGNSGTSGSYDRHVYMQDNGQLVFGTWTGQTNTITTPSSYNNGRWHHLVATQSSDGMKLYVDGALVGTNPQTQAQSYTGYWRVGGDTTWGSSSAFFAGTIDEAAVYSAVLTPQQVAQHYQAAGGVLPNVPPVAALTATTTGLALSVDGSGSSDPDGTLASYAWNFGDGATGTGATASHTYAAAGTYPVALTVTDNTGATGTVSKSVTVTAAAPTAIATDLFARTVAGGWGTSNPGGAWTLNGSSSLFSVNGSAGLIKMASAGAGPSVYLNTVSTAEMNGSVDIALDKAPTGSGFTGSAMIRRVGTSSYMVKLRLLPTSTSIQIAKVVGGTETVLSTQTVTGLTYQVGDVVRLSFRAKGTSPSTISAKAWKVGTTEPTAWRATVTDSDAALQGAGSFGLQAYLTGSATNAPVVASFDNLAITP